MTPRFFAKACLTALVCFLVSTVFGGVIDVTSLNNSGSQSLRQAVADAEDGDTIRVLAVGTIELVSEISISKNIEIIGELGPESQNVSGGGSSRLFSIAAGAEVKLSGLTLSEGYASRGGAIVSRGMLSLERMRFVENSAYEAGGAIYQKNGTLAVEQCYFVGNVVFNNGGAIAAVDTNVILRSSGFGGLLDGEEFANGAGSYGGAVWTQNSGIDCYNSTFYKNFAVGRGGTFFLDGGNGELANLTFVENRSLSYIYANVEAVNGAGFVLNNSILIGETSGVSPNVTQTDGNLVGTKLELGLGTLSFNGGVSPTFPLQPGSPAIDASENTSLALGTRDQRGLSRFQDGDADEGDPIADVGAFEVQNYVVTSVTPVVSSFRARTLSVSVTPELTFPQAVELNNATGGGVVSFSESLIPGEIFLSEGEIVISKDLFILGPQNAAHLVVRGDGSNRIFKIIDEASVTMRGFSIVNGFADMGGGILVESGSELELEGVSVSNNVAETNGGGIAVESGTLYAYRSSFVQNSASSLGGAIYATSGLEGIPNVVVSDNSTFSQNQAGAFGGGIYANGSLLIQSSALLENRSNLGGDNLALGPEAEASITNSIVAKGNASPIWLAEGAAVWSGGYNLSDIAEPIFTQAEDQIGADPFLDTLAQNSVGTFSYQPMMGSPVVDTGGDDDPSLIDQPGLERVRGGSIDKGPVEVQNDRPFVSIEFESEIECTDAGGAAIEVTTTLGDPDSKSLKVVWMVNNAVVKESEVAVAGDPVVVKYEVQFPLGVSQLSVSVSDGYVTETTSEVVNVTDPTPPAITLLGDSMLYLECGDAFVDPGATALDNCDGALLVEVDKSDLDGLEESLPIGTYEILYKATNSVGLASTEKRTVIVEDKTPPTLTLKGEAVIDLEMGVDEWDADQVQISDDCDLDPTLSFEIYQGEGLVDSIDLSAIGSYTVVYTGLDASGNKSTASIEVNVVDTTEPVLNETLPDLDVLTKPGYCFATVEFLATATDNSGETPTIVFNIKPNVLFPEGVENIPSVYDFPAHMISESEWLSHEVEYLVSDNYGNSVSGSFFVTVTDPYRNCISNTSWPNALPLSVDEPVVGSSGRFEVVEQYLAMTDQARWYRFNVKPGSRITVVLDQLPENYDLVLYDDIYAEYLRLLELFNSGDSEQQELALIGLEFAPESFSPESFSPESFSPESFSPESFSPESFSPESFSPESFSPESFSPESFSPESFSPESFSPESFSPESFSPESFSPESFSPESFSPESFSPESFSPESFSPESFSGAQTASVIGYSAFPGLAAEGIAINSFSRSGDFYVRVRGSNGAFNVQSTFRLTVVIENEICEDVLGPESLGESTLPSPVAGGFETLIIWDSMRTPGDQAFEDKLQELADHANVNGVLVDVAQENRIVEANIQADLNPTCPYAKNLVATEIKKVIDAWHDLNPNLKYIVLLGDDEAIPFFRYTDEAFLANETNYIPPVKDNTHSQSSLRNGQILTQDPYGSDCELNLVTGDFPYPKLAVGRLVESVDDIAGQVDNFLNAAGALVPQTGFVSGYDFLDDAAEVIQQEFEAAIGQPIDSLIADSELSPSEGWTASDLATVLLGSRHDLVFLAAHFSTGSSLAADYETRLTAEEVLASGADFLNCLVFSEGCHSGYNTVDAHAILGITNQPDWAQAFAKLGAIFVAGTGYQYGDTEFVEYGERFYLEFARQLRTGEGEVSVGDALVKAKRKYLMETPAMRGIHEKTLLQVVLYGLPMFEVNVPGDRIEAPNTGANPGLNPTLVPPVSSAAPGPGNTLGLKVADISVLPQLEHKTLELDLVGTESDTVVAEWYRGTNGIVGNPAEPIRPLEWLNVSASNTLIRGVGFRGGSFENVQNYLPLTGAPTTEIRGVYGNFSTEVFYPIQPYGLSYFGTVCGATDGERLNVFPSQFLSHTDGRLGGVLRKFDQMDFRLYYNNNTNVYTNTYESETYDVIPALAPAPSIAKVESVFDEVNQEVLIKVRVTGSPAAGIHEVWINYTTAELTSPNGQWIPLDLDQDEEDSTLWTGVISTVGVSPASLRYMVQAVSGTGLVSLSTNLGAYYSVVAPTTLEAVATQIQFVDPVPSSGVVDEPIAVKAKLLDLFGNPLEGRSLALKIQNAKVNGMTDPLGVASFNLPLSVTTGSNVLMQATFAGDTTCLPSVASTSIDVLKKATHLEFINPPAAGVVATGADVVVELRDEMGTPLSERSVFFLLDFGTGKVAHSIITGPSGRASLATVGIPGGTAVVTAFFNDIELPDGSKSLLPDPTYLPAAPVSLQVTFGGSFDEDGLFFDVQEADVLYKPLPKEYLTAKLLGDLIIEVPISPEDLVNASPEPGFVPASVEAILAGETIASSKLWLEVQGDEEQVWASQNHMAGGVRSVWIRWSNEARFDSSFTHGLGPKISTYYVGENVTGYRIYPRSMDSYTIHFPDGGPSVVVKDGEFDIKGSIGLERRRTFLFGGVLSVAVPHQLVPGMEFAIDYAPGSKADYLIEATEGENFFSVTGSINIQLDARRGDLATPDILDDPDSFQIRVMLGEEAGVHVGASREFGPDSDGVPWSQESARRKKFSTSSHSREDDAEAKHFHKMHAREKTILSF